MSGHTPVLVEEVLAFLQPSDGGVFIDATLGAGGHATAILDRSSPGGRLLGIDRDADALRLARVALERYRSRTVFRHANFSEVAEVARAEGFQSVDAIVADLGVSSMMLDQPGRGFSFQSDGPLDMRMDQEQSTTAADIVNHTRERELADLIFKFGEERRSRPIARAIVGKRPLHTTAALARVVESVSGPRRHGRIHPATRTFMALRLVVNRELENLEKFLDTAPGLLADGGRLAVISFHSLEDRIVKHRMRALGHVLTKKVVRAGDDERRSNPRSQSAKLRVMEKK